MSVIIWNCRGAGNEEFRRIFRSMLDYNRPFLVALLETKLAGHQAIMEDFGFTKMTQVAAQGNSGGMVMMWNEAEVTIDQVASTEQEIHAMVKLNDSPHQWLLSVIYASCLLEEKSILWNNLKIVANSFKGPWLVTGDFNEVTGANEKFGGLPVNNNRVSNFINCIDYCELLDLGFKETTASNTTAEIFDGATNFGVVSAATVPAVLPDIHGVANVLLHPQLWQTLMSKY
ncbi:PREDICTED: uncharacterized protein LOC109218059, partial [Nicotiana attenuata]|uniref:uncharacterized protein LOC109218059 n=1 Tax=Nicotiana attenuata TaxID=49451 RepID=UPI000904B065